MTHYYTFVGVHEKEDTGDSGDEKHVCLNILRMPFMTPVAHLPMDAEQAILLAGQLIEGAEMVDPDGGGHGPAPKPRYRVKVYSLREDSLPGLWTFSCPAHEDAGIGLWHDQSSAFTAATNHLTERHQ